MLIPSELAKEGFEPRSWGHGITELSACLAASSVLRELSVVVVVTPQGPSGGLENAMKTTLGCLQKTLLAQH